MSRSTSIPVRSMTVVVLALVMVACGSDPATETSPGSSDPSPVEAPTSATSSTTTPAVGDVGGWPGACVDVFVSMLKEMEPIVEGVGLEEIFEDEEFEGADELDEIGDRYMAQLEDLDCPQVRGEAAYRQLIQLAERHAPGTVEYMEAFAQIAELVEGWEDEEQDCDDLLAAAEALLDPSIPIEDMSPQDQLEASRLVTAMMSNCDLDVVEEFMSQFDD